MIGPLLLSPNVLKQCRARGREFGLPTHQIDDVARYRHPCQHQIMWCNSAFCPWGFKIKGSVMMTMTNWYFWFKVEQCHQTLLLQILHDTVLSTTSPSRLFSTLVVLTLQKSQTWAIAPSGQSDLNCGQATTKLPDLVCFKHFSPNSLFRFHRQLCLQICIFGPLPILRVRNL